MAKSSTMLKQKSEIFFLASALRRTPSRKYTRATFTRSSRSCPLLAAFFFFLFSFLPLPPSPSLKILQNPRTRSSCLICDLPLKYKSQSWFFKRRDCSVEIFGIAEQCNPITIENSVRENRAGFPSTRNHISFFLDVLMRPSNKKWTS